jgi:hypothetical protein
VRLSITSFTRPEDGVTCIEITSVVSSGLPGGSSTEKSALDWSTWEKRDILLGHIKGKMGWSTAAELTENDDARSARFLRGMMLKDGCENDGLCDEEAGEERRHIRMLLESCRDGWVGEHVWGFEMVEGQRRYTRRIVVRKGDRVEMARLVYDYIGQI